MSLSVDEVVGVVGECRVIAVGVLVIVSMSSTYEGWIVVSEADAAAFRMDPMFRFGITENGSLSLIYNLVTNSADVSGWTRVHLYISP